MNPVFVILVLLGAIILWFLMSFAFIPFGKFVHRIYKDVVNQMEEKDKDDNNNNQK